MTIRYTAAELTALVQAAAGEGLIKVAQRVRGVTEPLTPLEYGDLRSSLTVVPDTAREAAIDLESAVVSDLPYAVRQHEDLDYRHDDGEAKYLEKGTARTKPEIEAIMGKPARQLFGGS